MGKPRIGNLVHPKDVPEGAVPMTRVAIIDDQGIFRGGLCDILESTPDLVLVGDSSEPGKSPLETDVLVVAEMSGRWTQVVSDLSAAVQTRTVVLILDVTDDATLDRARELGVASCVPRSAPPEAFIRAITHAVRVVKPNLAAARPHGNTLDPAETSAAAAPSQLERGGAAPDDCDGHAPADGTVGADVGSGSPLGARDVEILASVAAGFSNRQVGDRLGLSDQTVKNRLTSILRKLGAVDRTEAVVTAIRHRWLPLEMIPPREAVSEYAG